jgi:hypothetical protein
VGRNAGSGSDAYGARTVASDGSRLLIFVRSNRTDVWQLSLPLKASIANRD